MAIEVRVPAVGESVSEGMIAAWLKNSGDHVNQDEILLELETDKATVEIAAPATGILEINVPAKSVVKIGDVIANIKASAEGAAKSPVAKSDMPVSSQSTMTEAASAPLDKLSMSGPAVRRMAAEEKIDVAPIKGSGRDGRVTKEDLLKSAEPVKPSKAPVEPKLEPQRSGGTRREPMSMLRRRIAERLLSAQATAAILTTFNEVDMTAVMDLRNTFKDAFQEKHGVKLGFMGFFLKASVEALKAFPLINAYIEGTDIVFHDHCDIGVAVSTEKGLVVPVIRGIQDMSIAEIEKALAGYANKARQNKISVDDLTGGTFTVSNGGVFGSLLSTPILNPPQSAILGMHKTQMRPIVMPDGSIVARPMMYLALSYDHRIVDGKEAVQFLVKIKDTIEDPRRFILGV